MSKKTKAKLRSARIAFLQIHHRCTLEDCKECAKVDKILSNLDDAIRKDERDYILVNLPYPEELKEELKKKFK
jgi:hypothetical protein